MINRLASLLKIRADESRLVILVALLFACIQAGQGMGDNAASALFLLRFGVDFLPYMYIAAGALTFVITMAYSAGLGRLERSRFFLWMLGAFAALLILERAAILLQFPFLYPALWLTINGMSGILGTFVWNLAGEVCDARQAKRLFPLFTSAGILGSVVGNAITGIAAKLLGTDNLLLLYAALLGVAFYVTSSIARSYFRKEKAPSHKSSLWDDLRAGYDFVRTSPLMRLIAYSSVLFSVLFFAIAFPFNKVVTTSFPDEAGVAGFFGLFNSIATAVTFLVSLLLANRIYARLGIINGVLLMPITYVFCFLVFAVRYELWGAAIARFAQLVILSGIAGTAWNALFNVVPSQKRGQVLAFNNGIPSQIGVMLSGVLLIIADKVLTVQQIFLMGTIVALVCAIFLWRMRSAYAQALVDALLAGRLEVFSASDANFKGLQADAVALQVVTKALQDSKPTTRRLAAQLAGKMQAVSAIPALIPRLADPDADVRAAVIEALGILRVESAQEKIIACLDDPEELVREQALSFIAQFKPDTSAALLEKLANILNEDPSIIVRMRAASTLAKSGLGERALPRLKDWLSSEDSRVRIAGIRTTGEVIRFLKSPIDGKLLLSAIEDPSNGIRREACHALTNLAGMDVSVALINRLSDTDESVRIAAAGALRQRGDESHALVLEVLDQDSPAVDAALDAIPQGNFEMLAPLREYAKREIIRARTLRNQLASLPSPGRVVAFLRDRLRAQSLKCEGRLIRTVGLFGDMQTMNLVRKGMYDKNAEYRAAALEALDTIGERQIARQIVAFLEEEPRQYNPSEVINSLLRSRDPWLRILAVRSIPELGLEEFVPVLDQLKSDPAPLLREAVIESLFEIEKENPMDTLNIVSILERVLLLREIPIFAELSPEDLKLVADVAQEEWYPQNTAIFHQGDEGNMMYVIVEGHLHVVRTVNEKDQVLAQRAGDFVGEMAIIESIPRSATLRTQSEVRVLAINGETFNRILHERPDVAFAVLRSISRRLREMAE